MSRYEQKYGSYLDVLRRADVRASDRELTVCDSQNMLLDNDVGAWVKLWLLCGGRDMSVSRWVSSEVHFRFVCC